MGNSLIGSYSAKFDRSSRIKIPEKFRVAIEDEYGKETFVTSLSDESVQIYPLSVWLKLTAVTTEGALHLKPTVRKFMLRVNRKGNKCLIDSKGRVLIPQNLRENAKLEEEVEVIGLSDHLEVWNKNVLDESIEQGPLTNEDFENMADLLPQDKNK